MMSYYYKFSIELIININILLYLEMVPTKARIYEIISIKGSTIVDVNNTYVLISTLSPTLSIVDIKNVTSR